MKSYIQKPKVLEDEWKKILDENKKLKEEQIQSHEKVKLLIAKVSHEFKTPLNSILGFAELIKNKTNNEKITEYSNIILNCSDHMLTLVQNIIDVTRATYKPMELTFSIFNPKEVIKDIIDSYNNPNINYTLINCTIVADYVRFKQLIINLISNAVKFNNINQNIKIITYIEDENFCFEISDNGEGISKDNLKKIFDFFAQVTDEKEKRELGSGIGLSLCKTIVTAHKGNIYVQSDKGKGSVFTFKLPINTK